MKATGPGPGPGLGNFSKNGLSDNFVCMQDLRPIFGTLLCDFGKCLNSPGRKGGTNWTHCPPPDPHPGVMVGGICRGWGLDNIIGGGRGVIRTERFGVKFIDSNLHVFLGTITHNWIGCS